jgi:hypothetical protein
MREILLKLVSEIEDLRANQIPLVQLAGQGIHLIDAQDAKKKALKENLEFFEAIRHSFDLVCDQGRLEAFRELDEKLIPAIVTDALEPDRHLMSLVENIARRPPSHKSIHYELRTLRERGYESAAIAKKLGLDRTYISGIVHLVKHGEANLIQEVEAGKLPIPHLDAGRVD